MQKEIADPIEQERIVSEFLAKQQMDRAEKKKRKSWTGVTILYLIAILVFAFGDSLSGGLHTWRMYGILFVLLLLWAFARKIAMIEEKIDRLTELLEERKE